MHRCNADRETKHLNLSSSVNINLHGETAGDPAVQDEKQVFLKTPVFRCLPVGW